MLKKALVILVSLSAVILGLVSCKTTSQEKPWYQSSGKYLYVELDANATTGYDWTVTIEGPCVQLDQENYIPHNAPEGMVGVGGTWKCTLSAICDGEATLNFTYARPWDKTDIAETRILKVTVSNGKISADAVSPTPSN